MMTMDWITCGGDDHWCSLERVVVDNLDVIGVYIIWHEGTPSRVVKIGRGNIALRLSALQNDGEILSFGTRGVLRVTWANAAAAQLDGIVRYLIEKWRPPVLTLYSEAPPIEVNSPWTRNSAAEASVKTPLAPRAPR